MSSQPTHTQRGTLNNAPNGGPLRLNAFQINLSAPEFQAFTQPMPDNKDLKLLRRSIGNEWFLYWKDGVAYGIPRVPNPSTSFGKPEMFKSSSYLGLAILNARANELLPKLLPRYEPLSSKHPRGFQFLARKVELVGEIINGWSGVPPLAQSFKIRPRFTCETRLLELRRDELQIALVLGVAMSWSAEGRLADLSAAGIDLCGLHVIRRNPTEGQRRLVGRIARLEGDKTTLDESLEGLTAIAAEEVQLEGSRAVFAHCLKELLGARYEEFNEQREQKESNFLTGPGLHECLNQFFDQFRKAKALELAPGLFASIGERVNISNAGDFRTAIELDPVEYCYDAAKAKRHHFAWDGLEQHGPYSRDSFPKRSPRVLVVCPDVAQPRIEQVLRHLRQGIVGSKFPKGFERVFNLVNLEFAFCTIPWSKAQSNFVAPAQLYHEHVEEYLASDSSFEAALVVILDEHARLPDKISPYLFAKGLLLTNGIPVQEARVSTLTRQPGTLQYILQNLSIALYAKMGGTPWTVNQDLTVNDEIVIGMGLAEVSGSRFEERQRHVGITTVFRGDGNYLLANISKECHYGDYPGVLTETMTDVLRDIRERNGWRKGDIVRVVFHASKPLRNLEVDELMEKCVREAAPEQNVQFAFLDVLHDHSFRVFDYLQGGRKTGDGAVKGKFVPKRGLVVQIGKSTRLLCTNGPSQVKRPVSPLPVPLLIHLHPHSTGCDLTYLTDQILKFTSLTWRSTQPTYTPVTIYYSELIAELLVRLKKVPGWSPAPLNTKLRSSMWFL